MIVDGIFIAALVAVREPALLRPQISRQTGIAAAPRARLLNSSSQRGISAANERRRTIFHHRD